MVTELDLALHIISCGPNKKDRQELWLCVLLENSFNHVQNDSCVSTTQFCQLCMHAMSLLNSTMRSIMELPTGKEDEIKWWRSQNTDTVHYYCAGDFFLFVCFVLWTKYCPCCFGLCMGMCGSVICVKLLIKKKNADGQKQAFPGHACMMYVCYALWWKFINVALIKMNLTPLNYTTIQHFHWYKWMHNEKLIKSYCCERNAGL